MTDFNSGQRWKVYKNRYGFWTGDWIAQPPGAEFEDSFGFDGPRAFDNALNFAVQQARQPQEDT